MYAATRAKYTDIQIPWNIPRHLDCTLHPPTRSSSQFVDGAAIIGDESNLSTQKSLDNNSWNFSSYCQMIRNLMARNHL